MVKPNIQTGNSGSVNNVIPGIISLNVAPVSPWVTMANQRAATLTASLAAKALVEARDAQLAAKEVRIRQLLRRVRSLKKSGQRSCKARPQK